MGWIDEAGNPSVPGGKAIRPALALLSAQAVDAELDIAVPAAAAVELVHNLSLLHDDVMDGDVERRHRPTAWRVFGVPSAILAGDAMLTVAMDTARSHYPAEVQACLSTAVRRLIAGQTADVDFERRAEVSIAEYLDMAGNKTSALMNCACAIGAIAAGAPTQLSDALGEFGEHLGLAFQIVDDLLGIWGSPEVTGKPALSDLLTRKKTLPVLAAMNSDTPAGAELRERYPDEKADIQLLADLTEKAGGREWAIAEADQHLQTALRAIEQAPIAPGTRTILELTARFVTERDR
jgi:geranylgeranyl diphosphate synthase type I